MFFYGEIILIVTLNRVSYDITVYIELDFLESILQLLAQ